MELFNRFYEFFLITGLCFVGYHITTLISKGRHNQTLTIAIDNEADIICKEDGRVGLYPKDNIIAKDREHIMFLKSGKFKCKNCKVVNND